jgi:hypothetical protein
MPCASLAGLTRAGGLAFGHDRFALIARTPDQGTQLRFLDQNATEVSSPFMVRMDLFDGDSRRLDVAWLESRGAFVVASTQPARSDRIDITMVDENGASLERLTVVAPSDVVGVHIAAGPRRALVILQQPTHILQGVLLGGQPVSVLAGPFDLLVNDGRGNAAPTVFAYDQDHFLVAGFDGHEVRVSTVDAADCGRMPVQPRVIAPSTNLVQMAGIATAPERGFYAVCFTDGSTTRVQAVGEDGTPWGRPFDTMIDDADTACGWDGEHVLVVSGRDSVRLRPTFL